MTRKEAYRKMALLCSKREYCKFDIVQKLNILELSTKDINAIISELEQNQFIDENRFALAFSKEKFLINQWGKIKIKHALNQKRIDKTSIDSALNCIEEEQYMNTIKKLIFNKLKTTKIKNKYEIKQQVLRFLIQRGFEFELSADNIDLALNEL